MVRLQVIAQNRWLQPFQNRQNDVKSWSIPRSVVEDCKIENNSRRSIRIIFSAPHDVDIEQCFTISSGCEILFPKQLQDLIGPIVFENPSAYFVAEIVDGFLPKDIEETLKTSALRTVEGRLGQQVFRKQLIERWKGCCSVTHAGTQPLLRASHIKPWCVSTSAERLDVNNGLLLTPNLDALFDKGFISFKDSGELIVSPHHPHIASEYDLQKSMRLRQVFAQTAPYLAYHRDMHGMDF